MSDRQRGGARRGAYVLVLDVLEELKLPICTFAEDGGAEGFHDLLDRNGRASELIFRRAGQISG